LKAQKLAHSKFKIRSALNRVICTPLHFDTGTQCIIKTQDKFETLRHNSDGKCAICHLI